MKATVIGTKTPFQVHLYSNNITISIITVSHYPLRMVSGVSRGLNQGGRANLAKESTNCHSSM